MNTSIRLSILFRSQDYRTQPSFYHTVLPFRQMYQPLPLLPIRLVLRTVVLVQSGPEVGAVMGAVVGAVLMQGVEEGAGLLGYKQAPVVAGYWSWFRLLHTFVFLYFGQLGVVPRSLPPDSHHLSFVLVCT